MSLILTIEPDHRQAVLLSSVLRRQAGAELILVDTTERALDAIGNRVPDLVLVPALLSPQDDAALATALRVIASAARVQMLTIPLLRAPQPRTKSTGVLLGRRRDQSRSAEPEGCDPTVFAEQVASYLERAAEERASLLEESQEDIALVEAADVVTAEPPLEPLPPEAVPDVVETASESTAAVDDSVWIALDSAVRAQFMDAPVEPELPVAQPPVEDPIPATEETEAAVEPPVRGAFDETLWHAVAEAFRDQMVPVVAPPVARGERPWVELIESLRHDVARLRTEPPTIVASATAAARSPRPGNARKPAQNEWGFFDPEQCGFAALLAKLDEVTESDESLRPE